MNLKKTTGVLLAGGKNSRMGTDKGQLIIDGKKIAEKIIQELKPVTAGIMIISNGENYDRWGYKIYSDIIKNTGPMGGIFTALSLSKTEKIMVAACDMPFVKKEIFLELIENSGDCEIVVPEIDNKPQPLCGVYSTVCLNRFSRMLAGGKWKMKDALDFFKTKRIKFSENHFVNINTPEEYENIKNQDYEHTS